MKLKHKNTILFITGGPGTGKSYVSHFILENIKELSLLSYDTIKENAWDRFGFDNISQKERLNRFSLEEFYLTLQKMMWERKTILTEYPFYQRHKEELKKLVVENHYHAITLLLEGDWKVIYERGLARDKNDNRHPGHLTNRYHKENTVSPKDIVPDAKLTYEEFRSNIDKKNYDIQLGTTIKIDVTDYHSINYNELLKQIAFIDAQY